MEVPLIIQISRAGADFCSFVTSYARFAKPDWVATLAFSGVLIRRTDSVVAQQIQRDAMLRGDDMDPHVSSGTRKSTQLVLRFKR